MIVLFALLGAAAGWLIELLADDLLRFSSLPHPATIFRLPALLTLRSNARYADAGIELFTGCLFALLYGLHGISTETLWLMLVSLLFVLIAVMDYRYQIVLNVLTYPGLIAALVVNIALLHIPALNVLLGVVFAFLIFYLAAMVKPGGLGGGDVKLAALIGAILGFPQVLGALLVGALASALIIVVMLLRRRTLHDSIPYAPFLCLGALVVFIYSSTLILV